jgi:AraC-like DNA-binding protein
MGNHIIDITIGILIILICFLSIKRNYQNKFHLDYIINHTFLLLASSLIYKGIMSYDIGTSFFDLIHILHIGSFIYLTLHVESAIKGNKTKISPLFGIPIVLYMLVMILNYYGIYILNYHTVKSSVLLLKIDNPIFFSDKILIKSIGVIPIFVYLFRLCFKHIRFSNTIRKKRLYEIWIYSYLFILVETILITNCYYFNITNPVFDNTIQLIIRINAMASVIFFLSNPFILKYLPLIKGINIIEEKNHVDTFSMVQYFFKNEKAYLKKRITIKDVVDHIGTNKKKVQKAIFSKSQLNFNDFVNSYRIERSIELIDSNYLIKKNLKSLSVESGFNSHQTFYRAFKKNKGCTPTEYWKDFKNSKISEEKT